MFRFLLSLTLCCVLPHLSAQLRPGDRLWRTSADGLGGILFDEFDTDFNTNRPLAASGTTWWQLTANQGYRTRLTTYDYRRVKSERFAYGLGLSVATFIDTDGDDFFGVLGLVPAARYYVNRVTARTPVFAEVAPELLLLGGSDDGGGAGGLLGAAVRLGAHLTVAPNILLTPLLEWKVRTSNGRNLQVGLSIETILSRRGQQEGSAAARFRAGTLLFGTDGLRLNRRANFEGSDAFVRIGPTVHRFFGPRTALGLRLGFGYRRRSVEFFGTPEGSVLKDIRFDPELRLRQYIGKMTGRALAFAEVGAGGGLRSARGTQTFGVGQVERDSLRTSYGTAALGAGVQLFISEALSFEFGPTVRYRSFRDEEELTEGTWTVSYSWGVRWLLPR